MSSAARSTPEASPQRDERAAALHVLVTVSEKTMLRRYAARAGLSLSEAVRRVALAAASTEGDPTTP